jgi:nucleoid-associated protein YgaU
LLFSPALFARPLADNASSGYAAVAETAFGTVSSDAGLDTDVQASRNLPGNEYYRESLRLTKLARETYDYGDFDLAREYAEKALEYGRLSALQLEAAEAIAAANRRIDWASEAKADQTYPEEFAAAKAARDNAEAYLNAENWDDAIAAAHRAIETLAFIQGGTLPAQYRVRPWRASHDCFWNIAGRDWVYGDSSLWRHLYNANRSKLKDPDNPDLLSPDIILDIPSLKGEIRQGLWEEGR